MATKIGYVLADINVVMDFGLSGKGREDMVLSVEAQLSYKLMPGEPPVRYYLVDGSGCPGSPAKAELLSLKVVSMSGENHSIERCEFPELCLFVGDAILGTYDASYWESLFFDKWDGTWPEED